MFCMRQNYDLQCQQVYGTVNITLKRCECIPVLLATATVTFGKLLSECEPQFPGDNNLLSSHNGSLTINQDNGCEHAL